MSKYLEDIKNGRDPLYVIQEMQEELNRKDMALEEIAKIIMNGGDVYRVISDIMEIVPAEAIKKL